MTPINGGDRPVPRSTKQCRAVADALRVSRSHTGSLETGPGRQHARTVLHLHGWIIPVGAPADRLRTALWAANTFH